MMSAVSDSAGRGRLSLACLLQPDTTATELRQEGSGECSAETCRTPRRRAAGGSSRGCVPHEFPDDLKDLVYAYLRIHSAELKAAAVRAVRAIAQS